MVIYSKKTGCVRIFEIKHSDRTAPRQTRYLRDEEKLALITGRFGKIEERAVIYRGCTQNIDGIEYINVEEYLNGLK